MVTPTSKYLPEPVSNGNPEEQALIRRWWHEEQEGHGRIVWEYFLQGKYADAIWFPSDPESGVESPGNEAPSLFPLKGADIVLCEAKEKLNPEVIGQALVYSAFARRMGANMRETIVFTQTASDSMRAAALEYGLTLFVRPLQDVIDS